MKYFHSMLSATITDMARIQYPVLASPKYDGIRASVQHGRVMSRNLKLIPNQYVQKIFGRTGLDGLDGELVVNSPVHHACFRTTGSAVMRRAGQPQVTLWVFDWNAVNIGLAFQQRLKFAEKLMRPARGALPHWPNWQNPNMLDTCLKLVPQYPIESERELLAFEKDCLHQGYEGVMLRDPYGPYKEGRSTEREGYLLRLKRFSDSEAVITQVQELLHNNNVAMINQLGRPQRSSHKANKVRAGVMGALVVRGLKTKVTFNIGIGFSAEERKWFWQWRDEVEGKVVKYSYFPTGSKTKPRFPKYLGFRDRKDLSK